MTSSADMIIERRRIRRSLTVWRVIAIVAIVVAVIAFATRFSSTAAPHIARISLSGVIFHEPDREKLILDLVNNDDAKALILMIDSPGGTLVGSEAIYDAVRKVAETKPVVAVMSELAASGGYLAALGADHIVARRNTLTGSIGVVMETPNVEGLLEMLGVEVTRLKSAPLKAEPSYTTKPTEEALAATQVLIDDGFAWFRGLVADRRGLEGSALDRVADGRVFTGGQAIDLGLIDALGDQQTAVDWLQTERGLDADLKVRDHEVSRQAQGFPWELLEDASASILQPQRLVGRAPRLYALMQQ